MEIKELRLGNLLNVKYPIINKMIRVGHISKKMVNRISLANYEPIELTEEILLRFGFEKHESKILPSYSISIAKSDLQYKRLIVTIDPGNTYVSIREGHIQHNRDEDDIVILFNSDYDGKLYTHWLQNIYSFLSLTNDELKLKD